MSDILSTISRGKRPRHIFALLYGTDGVGKSTLCSHAPNPIFVGAENGTAQLDVSRFPQTETIQELLDQLRAPPVRLYSFTITFSIPDCCTSREQTPDLIKGALAG
jgi:Cdc6-like AAA superfamily ATPase